MKWPQWKGGQKTRSKPEVTLACIHHAYMGNSPDATMFLYMGAVLQVSPRACIVLAPSSNYTGRNMDLCSLVKKRWWLIKCVVPQILRHDKRMAIERETFPICSCIWTLGPQLQMLCEEVMEPLGGAVLLSLSQWGSIASFYFLFALSAFCVDKMWPASVLLLPPCHVFHATVGSIPLET